MKSFSFFVPDTGRLTDASRQIMANVIATMAGKRIKIAVSEWKESSSDRQRRYYFKIIVQGFMDYFANRPENPMTFEKKIMHDQLMRAVGGFSNPYVNGFTGEPDAGRMSYNDLTTAQCEGYHHLCRMEAAKRGFQILEPNENENYY